MPKKEPVAKRVSVKAASKVAVSPVIKGLKGKLQLETQHGLTGSEAKELIQILQRLSDLSKKIDSGQDKVVSFIKPFPEMTIRFSEAEVIGFNSEDLHGFRPQPKPNPVPKIEVFSVSLKK
jgi:hypothetical protein